MSYVFFSLFAFIAAVAGTRVSRFLAHRFQIVDHPDDSVKTHTLPTAYLGGVGIFCGFLAGFLGLWMSRPDPGFVSAARAGWLVLAAAAICLVGLIDDIHNISPRNKVIGQMLAAALATLFFGPVFVDLFSSFPRWAAAGPAFGVVLFFVLGASNSVNLLDGLDGLCGGVAVLLGAGFFVLSRLTDSPFSGIQGALAVSMGAAAAGFLVFNYPPASIFMGDAGSLLIGLLSACQMVLFLLQGPGAFLASLFIFGLPILDTAVAIGRRLLNQKPLFVSDRGHIYDQLVDRGLTKKQSIWVCYGLTTVSSAVGLAGYGLGLPLAVPLYVIVLVITFLIIRQKGFLKKV